VQKDDAGKQEQTGATSENDRDDAKKRPQDEQAKGASDSGKKTDDDQSDDQKSEGSGAKKTEKEGAEKKDRSKSGAAARDEKNEQSQTGEEKKGPSEEGAASDDAKGRTGQPNKNKGGESKSQKDGQPADEPARDGNEKRGDQNMPPDGKGTTTGGGGGPHDESAPPPEEPPVPPEDDKANQEYAKRATDLALDHLRNQLKDDRPDEELLDRLGWSKDDLKKLLARWERLQREAKQPGPAGTKGKENLQERINSLGWTRPGQATRKSSTNAGDAARGLRESAHSAPPQEYMEAFEAFKRRTSQGGK
jgi:hypothetical protein